jgi:para-nitrobenzyl esterase
MQLSLERALRDGYYKSVGVCPIRLHGGAIMDVVKTDSGYVSGTILGEPDKQVHVFRGVPYAAPPIGDLRWKPPQPVAPWSGIRECTAFSAAAPQASMAILPNLISDMPQSEDCLYLNILAPGNVSSNKLPVMVWLHGGGFYCGSGNQSGYNRILLPSKGILQVNVNMRLGALGCLAHPLLSRESPKTISGNYLFLDMIAALKWVQQNIATFGGDPDNVTIFGESGGSIKVINLMASPLAKGLFHRAIGESGGGSGTPLKEMEARGEKVFAKLGLDKEKDPVAAARALPWKKIIEAGVAVEAELKLPMSLWDSAVDGWFLTDTATNIFKAGKQNIVSFIMGANLGELTGPGTIIMPRVIPNYVTLFAGANKVGGKAYAYIFNYIPEGWKKEGAVSCHSMELPYVFGRAPYEEDKEGWATLFFLAKPGAKSPDPGVTDMDRQLTEMMMKIWTNFAKTGNPNIQGLVDWPTYQETTDQYLYITESLQVRSGFSKVAQK